MEYDVEREHGQWHIREKGQVSRGTTVTDDWLEQMGFGRLTRLNIDDVVRATMVGAAGGVLDSPAARSMPRDIAFTPGLQSFPSRPKR